MGRLNQAQNSLLQAFFAPAGREVGQVVTLYETQVFSGQPPAREQVKRGVRAWTRLRWRLWLANGWWRYRAGRSRRN